MLGPDPSDPTKDKDSGKKDTAGGPAPPNPPPVPPVGVGAPGLIAKQELTIAELRKNLSESKRELLGFQLKENKLADRVTFAVDYYGEDKNNVFEEDCSPQMNNPVEEEYEKENLEDLSKG